MIFRFQIVKSKPNVLYERSDSSILGSYVVDYGPVRVRHRRSASQTLATGRRSKDEPLYGEEAIKREIRRAKNRIAARELKKDRDQIEIDLVQKIQQLEEEKNDLQTQHKILEERRAQLNRAVYNAKQAALVPLITDMNISLFFPSQDQKNLLIDFYSLLQNIDEQCCMSDC